MAHQVMSQMAHQDVRLMKQAVDGAVGKILIRRLNLPIKILKHIQFIEI